MMSGTLLQPEDFVGLLMTIGGRKESIPVGF